MLSEKINKCMHDYRKSRVVTGKTAIARFFILTDASDNMQILSQRTALASNLSY